MEVPSQPDSYYTPELPALRGCGVDYHGNNDIPLLLLLWKNHEKTYPKVPFGAQPGRSARAKNQEECTSVGLVIPFGQLTF